MLQFHMRTYIVVLFRVQLVFSTYVRVPTRFVIERYKCSEKSYPQIAVALAL